MTPTCAEKPALACLRPAAACIAALLLCGSALPAAETVDWIVTARYLLPMGSASEMANAGARDVIEGGALAVRGDRILAVGPRADIEARFQARQTLHRPQSALLPGLINTHTHAPMSLFRGLADDRTLSEWLEKYIFPAESRNVTRDFVTWGTRLACLEMLLSGTTTYTDMYYFEDAIAEATREAGMRGVLGQTIIGFPAPDHKTPQDALRFTEQFLQRYARDPLIVPAVAPHAIYTNSDATLRQARALANRYQAPLLIHLSETRRENQETLAKRGASPTAALDALGLFHGRTLAAHGVWLDDADMALLKARGVGLAHCPSSNTKLASGVAPVVKMLSLGLAVGLGPDGPAGSNNDFNLFEEMDLAAKLQKVTRGDPQALPARQALAMATSLGARALGLENEIGSLAAGKRADWIAVRLDRPHATPIYDIFSQLVYASKGSDVQDVMIHGRLVVRDGQVLTLQPLPILKKAEEYRRRIQASLRP